MTVPPPPRPAARRSEAWHLAVALLVAPFYVGLFVVTAIGAAFSPRNRA